MNMAELQVTDTSLFTEFVEKEQEIGILRIALAANGQIESAQRLSKLELALGRMRERLKELSETLQPTDIELMSAYNAVTDLIETIDEILDQRGVAADWPGNVPLVG